MTNKPEYDILLSEREREVNKMFYWFTFEDGYSVCVKGFSKQEMKVENRKHGKLISKVMA